MATPFCAVLRERFPSARLSLLSRIYVAEIFRRNPAIDRVISYERSGDLWARLSTARDMKPAGGFDVCFVMPPSFAAALLALASGARRRIGYRFDWRGLLLTDSLPRARFRASHLSAAYVALLECVTGTEETALPLPAVFPPDGWRASAGRLVGTDDYLVLAAGATYGSSKVWPVERFAGIARLLAGQTGWAVVVVGTAAERGPVGRILSDAGVPGINLAGRCTTGELIAVLRGSRITIGNDSGPVHVAAALGRPTVAVFGPTSVDWTAPRGTAVRIVRGEAVCSPCFKRECPQGTPECLLNVSVDEVYHAAARLIEEGAGAKE